MRILITNDDGINAPGLSVLHEIAVELASGEEDVWCVAPIGEQSGVGHCISYAKPVMLTQLSKQRFCLDGTPADCVMAGVSHIMKDLKPDLVLSGVNRGNNAAENVLYSGTIGAAMEAALQGIPAIAMSQYYGDHNKDLDNPFEVSAHFGAQVVAKIYPLFLKRKNQDYGVFFNVNFPPCSIDMVKGARVVAQGRRAGVNFSTVAQSSPTGRQYLWAKCGDQHVPAERGTDVFANLSDEISITPMRANLTAYDVLNDMAEVEL